jgi:hypothetical protein
MHVPLIEVHRTPVSAMLPLEYVNVNVYVGAEPTYPIPSKYWLPDVNFAPL